jgi:hypothetical protein
MTAPYDPHLPRPDPFDPRRYSLVVALDRTDLVAIAALALDLMPVDDITRAETHASQLARLICASKPYAAELKRAPRPSPQEPTREVPGFDQCTMLSGGLRCVRAPGHAGRCDFD